MNNETKEKLASEVQKWPLLYDKSDKNYKNRVLVDQAWAKVAENMGMEMEGLFLLIKPCASAARWWWSNFNFNYTS